jgi:hypothetical protein
MFVTVPAVACEAISSKMTLSLLVGSPTPALGFQLVPELQFRLPPPVPASQLNVAASSEQVLNKEHPNTIRHK